MTRSPADSAHTYLWCDTCRRSFRHEETLDGSCPVCQHETRPIGKFAAIVRGMMSNELVPPETQTKHRQLIRMIWTRNGMGERYYGALDPNVSYKTFETRVTDLLCRGAEAGWVRFIFPPAPRADESAYRMELDEERFITELTTLFADGEATE